MPALVKRRVGSPWGTSDDEGTIVCPFDSKKRRNDALISLPRIVFGVATIVLGIAGILLYTGTKIGLGRRRAGDPIDLGRGHAVLTGDPEAIIVLWRDADLSAKRFYLYG